MSLLRVTLPKPKEFWWTTVAGEPQPKERPRVVGRHAFTPKRTVDAQDDMAWAVKAAHPRLKCDGDSEFGLRCVFYCTPSNRRQSNAMPDADNLGKLIRDGLQGTAWKNDSQVREDFYIVLPAHLHAPHSEILFYKLTPEYLRERDLEET